MANIKTKLNVGDTVKDIEIITPKQYEAEFGGDEDG